MNTKIAKALSLLFQLSDEDRAFVFRLWNMNEAEREVLIEALQPEKATTKKPVKQERRIEHCVACDHTRRATVHRFTTADGYHEFQSAKEGKNTSSKSASKSPRAQSLSGAIQRAGKVKVNEDDNDGPLCTVGIDSTGMTCGKIADHNVHHLNNHPDYHPFESVAPPAARKSSTNGGATGTTANFETGSVAAGVVVEGSSE